MDLIVLDQTVTEIVDEAVKRYINGDSVLAASQKTYLHSQSQIVTKADEQIDRFLHEKLFQAFLEYGFITEEQKNTPKAINWIIDPIDGTGNFYQGLPFYGISVGLWNRTKPVYGQIYLPGLKQRVLTADENKVLFNDITLTPEVHEGHVYSLLAPVGGSAEVAALQQGMAEAVGHPRDFGCCVFQAVQVFFGKADLLVGYRLSLWDLGAVAAIARALKMHLVTLYSNDWSIEQLANHEYGLSFLLANEKVNGDQVAAVKEVVIQTQKKYQEK